MDGRAARWRDEGDAACRGPATRGGGKSIAATLGLLVALAWLIRSVPDVGGGGGGAAGARVVAGRVVATSHGPMFALAWSPDGGTLAASHGAGRVALHEVDRGTRVLVDCDEAPRLGYTLGWSGDGRSFWLWGMDDAVTTRSVDDSPGGDGPGPSRRGDPGLEALAGVLRGGSVRSWGPADRRFGRQPLSTMAASVMAISPDGRTLAAGGVDGRVRACDAATGRVLWTTTMGAPGVRVQGVSSIAFAPDGASLAIAGVGPLRCFDAATGRERAALGAESGGFALVAYSGDGSRLAAASWAGSIRAWDAEGRDLATMPGQDNRIAALAWSPDGRTLAAGSYDGVLRVFDLGLDPPGRSGRPDQAGRAFARADHPAR